MATSSARLHRRVRTPTVLQSKPEECGAACLGIILEFFGRYVPLDTLRDDCGVSRDGSNALYIKEAAKRYGLETRAFRIPTERLMTRRPPLMVFWNFNHFLVVEGFARGKVYLNDPATGPRTVSRDEFEASYSGIAFAFSTTGSFDTPRSWLDVSADLVRSVLSPNAALLLVILAGLALNRNLAIGLYALATIPVSFWAWSGPGPVRGSSPTSPPVRAVPGMIDQELDQA
jgi:ABC-type bacteriocin/lantibiotic exporter with double-glycine peptidase domain